MIVRVLYFAALRDRAEAAEETIEIQDPTDVAGVWAFVQARHPRLREVTTRPLVACDMAYASWDRPVAGGEEIAFLPPVSGG